MELTDSRHVILKIIEKSERPKTSDIVRETGAPEKHITNEQDEIVFTVLH